MFTYELSDAMEQGAELYLNFLIQEGKLAAEASVSDALTYLVETSIQSFVKNNYTTKAVEPSLQEMVDALKVE